MQEELARARAPELVGRIGVNLAGPTLLAHGTDEQKDALAARASSRPTTSGASSSASPARAATWPRCTTRADAHRRRLGAQRPEGVDVVRAVRRLGHLPGPHRPDAPKHKGISYLVVDMRADGVEVRPLVQLTGEAEFNEVFLTDVFVPRDQLVGDENNGWRVANSTLSHERGTNPRQLVIHTQLLEELLRLAVARGAFDDRRLRQRLAQAYVEVRLFQLHNWRTLSRLEKGLEPGPEGSALKLYWSEMSKRLHDTAMAVLGAASPLWKGADGQPGRRRLAAVMALLPGGVDLRGHQRDPAQHRRRAGARPPPRARTHIGD